MNQKERLAEYRRQQNPFGDVLSHIQYVKGDKGDKGDQGEQGVPGNDGADGQTIIGPQGEKGERGAPGRDGADGVDGKNGKDGKDGKNGKDGQDADPQVTADIVLSQITTSNKLKVEHIDGLPKTLSQLINFLKIGGFRGGAGSSTATSITFFTDTITSGAIDGNNKVFGVTNIITTPLALHLGNSVYQPTVDFTTSGTTITMVSAPDISLSGQPFWLLHT